MTMLKGVSFTLGLAVALGAGLVLQPGAEAPARAQPSPQICPEKLVSGVASLLCTCPAEATASGSVWGADVYTDDSSICRAALHAGVIGTRGGIVLVREAPGQASYPATTRNSVASSSWGGWERSISFGSAGDNSALASCPDNAVGREVGDTNTCSCDAARATTGTVWGSGPYTADSALCRAAVHAGVIGTGGGTVKVRVVEGRPSFPASTRNGVATSSWPAYPTAITFDR
jgi:hypothetical protein